MLKSKLPYKLLLTMLVFAMAFIVPFTIIVYHGSEKMMAEMESIEPLATEQRLVHSGYLDEMTETIIAVAFYIFIIAFILSLFFSRRILQPVRELYRGAAALRDGRLDVKLDVSSGGELEDVMQAFNDMTDAMKVQNGELRRKEQYISTMRDPMWVADQDNIITDINPAFTDMFGYERDEVVGSSLFDFLDEESERTVRDRLRDRDRGESSTYEISMISKKEGLIPVLVSGSPIIVQEEVIGKIGIIKDFRQEKALRDDLLSERDFSEAIMQSLSDSLLVIDRDFRIVKANMGAVARAGRDVVGESCHRVFHASDEKCFLKGEVCPAKQVFGSGSSFSTVHRHIEAGVPVFHEISAYPVKNREGEVRYVVEILSDVSDRKKFDDEISQKNKELIALNSISRIISQTLKAEDIFNNVLDKVVELVGMDGGGIYFVDELGRDMHCKYYKGLSEEFIRTLGIVKMGQDLPGKVALTMQNALIPDVSRDEAAADSMLRHTGIKGFAATPIRGKEKVIGVFFAFSFGPHVFSPEEERLLNSVSEMMGIAFENIRLYEKMKELYETQRTRRDDEQKNLLALSSMLSATLDMQKLLPASLALVRDSCKADFAWLLEIDDTGSLRLRATSDKVPEQTDVLYPEEGATIEHASIARMSPVVYSKLDADRSFEMSETLKDFNTACSVPVHIGDKTMGALTIYYRMIREPREDDIHFIRTVASMLAVALERSRLYGDMLMEREMAATTLEGIADGVMTVDTSDTIISINRAAEEIVGVLPRSAVGMKRRDMLSFSDDNVAIERKMADCTADAMQGRQMTAEGDLINTRGERIPLMFKSAPIRNRGGAIVGVVYVLRDVRREKELDMLKTDFVKAVSHEFRTPLATIVGMAEMIIDADVEGLKAKEYVEAIHTEGQRLAELVGDVLDVARIEAGKEVYTEGDIDLKAIVGAVKHAHADEVDKKKIQFTSKVGRGVAGYRGDADKLKHLLDYLVDNAVTYCDPGTSLRLDVRKKEGDILVTVRDEGWGISAEDLRHMGERFYRGHHAVKAKGTGLGLAICKEIVRMHGGKMHIDSIEGKGTTVTVRLPFRR